MKHEFYNGEIYALAGGTPEHAALTLAIGAVLLVQLRGGSCRVFSSDLRVRVLATGLTAYPDVTVVCGELQKDPESDSAVTNPKLKVEVLSDGTAAYDRGEKLEQYKRIESVQAIVLFSQTSRQAELHERSGNGFRTEVLRGDASVPLPCIGAALSLAAVYSDAGL